VSQSDSFAALGNLQVGDTSYEIYRLSAVTGKGLDVATLPYSLKVLLENLLRTEDGLQVRAEDIAAVAGWDAEAEPSDEIQYTPARVLMQDFTGVPAVVDLAAMREAMRDLGGDPAKINPLAPAELVIDHSVIADVFGTTGAFERNVELEYERNHERYQFLRWGQGAFADFKVVPPGTGIVHQVNIEHLARVVFTRDTGDGALMAYPDTCVGTDSHTTMVNGLGVVGWGVGGIECHRNRPRAHSHGDAAPTRRCGQVRRVLRTGRRRRAARQPRHHRQHVAGVRLNRRGVPHRRGDRQLSAAHRPI
jgi:aconitate hydratase A / 2-methylisocitrate dehydratase